MRTRKRVKFKYVLEVNTLGEWQVEEEFSSADEAQNFGHTHFEQNEWKITEESTGIVLYEYDPMGSFAKDAKAEINRFKMTEKFRDHFANQKERRVLQAQREREAIANRGQYNPFLDPIAFIFGDDEDASYNTKGYVVNWLREGF
jgi:hypothetical protein